jgi:hypothetical protein
MTGTLKYIHQQQMYVTVATISYLDRIALPSKPSTARKRTKTKRSMPKGDNEGTPKSPQKKRRVGKASTSNYMLDDN